MADRALITTAGKVIIATALAAAHACRFIAHGTGTTQTEITDTTLEAKVAGDTPAQATESVVAGGKYRLVGTVTSVAGATITEVGLFPLVACAANIVYHETFTGVVLAAGDSITYTLDVIAG